MDFAGLLRNFIFFEENYLQQVLRVGRSSIPCVITRMWYQKWRKEWFWYICIFLVAWTGHLAVLKYWLWKYWGWPISNEWCVRVWNHLKSKSENREWEVGRGAKWGSWENQWCGTIATRLRHRCYWNILEGLHICVDWSIVKNFFTKFNFWRYPEIVYVKQSGVSTQFFMNGIHNQFFLSWHWSTLCSGSFFGYFFALVWAWDILPSTLYSRASSDHVRQHTCSISRKIGYASIIGMDIVKKINSGIRTKKLNRYRTQW